MDEATDRSGQPAQASAFDAVARLTPRALAGLVVLSAAVGASGAVGASYVLGQGQPLFDAASTWALAVAGGALFAIAALLSDLAFEAMALRARAPREGARASARARMRRLVEAVVPAWDGRHLLVGCAVMGACWLPWLVANYPAGAYWDTYYQIWQTFDGSHPIALIPFGDHADATRTDAFLCDHHPVLDTLVYGAFAQASQALTGTWQLGVFAFACLQGALTVVSLVVGCAYLRRIGAPLWLCAVGFAYLCTASFVSSWALTMVKDSLFSLVYIPYFLMLCELVRTRGAWLAGARNVAWFVVVGLLLCLTKKTGLWVVVPTALAALALYRARWRPLLAQAGTCVLAMGVVLPLVLFPLANVAPGGRQEALGPLLQQTAAYVAQHSGDTTAEERAAIEALVPYDRLAELYDWRCQDDVKYEFDLEATDQEVGAYLAAWAAQGLRHPDAYLGALMGIAGSYLAPCQALNVRTTTCDTYVDDVRVLFNPPELDWLREGMAAAYDAWCALPVACLPLLACVYVWWLPLLLLYVAWRRRLRVGLLFVPGAVVLAFCLIGPIFDARYCLPLLYTLPFLAGAVAAAACRRPLVRTVALGGGLGDNGERAEGAAGGGQEGKDPR